MPVVRTLAAQNYKSQGEGSRMSVVSKNENTLLKQALSYYQEYGWSIIPVPYGKKAARVKWGKYQNVRPDEKQLRKWFVANNRNIAVILGEVSNGLACRDFDTMAEYEKWAKDYPDLAKMLPTVQTTNGMHVYFEGHVEGIKHISNGELRGKGGYCLLPPSVHPEGQIYQWINPVFNGNLLVVDPELAGFLPDVTENTEKTEKSEQTEQSDAVVIDEVIDKAIIETLPFEFGTRNRKIFEFARTIKTLPQFTEADPKQFREIVKAWHNRALPNIRTKEFEETWIDFLKAWPRIKYLKGQEPIMNVFEKAISLEPPKVALEKYPEHDKLKVLVSLCRELQRAAGQNPFFLSVRTAGRLLGVSRIVEKGGTAQTVRKATRYRYIAS
jgi:hypothetical protein